MLLWLCFTVLLTGVLCRDFRRGNRTWLTPGATSPGHYQIEKACNLCHTPFAGVRQDACLNCHAEELERADDSHLPAKFLDPRNADRVKALDARVCITCHVEHRPAYTRAMTVSQPADYCVHCHADIATERPTHRGFAFDGCTAAGCHNFHDNRALTADFLRKHAGEPEFLATARLPVPANKQPLPVPKPDATGSADVLVAWRHSAHARANINCSDCHSAANSSKSGRVNHQVCRRCHEEEVGGFFAGRHGMRLAAGLSPMIPAKARRRMRDEASHRELGCNSCHGAHKYDRRFAAVDACLGCHADKHSLAYRSSPHARLWQRELAGELPAGSGVSCASCHMPRMVRGNVVAVEHNQNATLRPNENMIRPVCGHCHGVGFAIDALADRALVDRNFAGRPARHVPSIDMVRPAN